MIEVECGIFEHDNNSEVFMVGDIHGDYQCLVHCLVDLCQVCTITKLYDDIEFNNSFREYLEWNLDNNSIVVLCGDFIHRKRFPDHVLDDECSDIFIIKTLLRLNNEAKKSNGKIIILSGNHEIMNLINPDDNTYTSDKNIKYNKKYFTNTIFINEYINNSYAWIKINDILIAHGGLCSEYLKYLDKYNLNSTLNNGNSIVKYINEKYREYFKNYNYKNIKTDTIGYNLFIEYNYDNKNTHNMFWCREWGYSTVNCSEYETILARVDCKKMIIAHCPQFLSPDEPKMINFDCNYGTEQNKFKLARVDLGMSRAFEYNQKNNFLGYLNNNFNRKISILKLKSEESELFFNESCIITEKISCIQYLLLKYGISINDWLNYNIETSWLGFELIEKILVLMTKQPGNKNIFLECADSINSDPPDSKKPISNLLQITAESHNSMQEFDKKRNYKIKKSENFLKITDSFEVLSEQSVSSIYGGSSNNLSNDNKNILCLLYPIIHKQIILKSVTEFRNFKNKR
jgi:hypothetical protein